MSKVVATESVFKTPWLEVFAKTVSGQDAPYYSVKVCDYVCVVALDPAGSILLVRQFRAAVDANTLELPAGTVDGGEKPEVAAHRELIEETGHEPQDITLLGSYIWPDTGRLDNRMYCYGVKLAKPVSGWQPAAGEVTRVIQTQEELGRSIDNGEFRHALHLAAVLLAARKGFLF